MEGNISNSRGEPHLVAQHSSHDSDIPSVAVLCGRARPWAEV